MGKKLLVLLLFTITLLSLIITEIGSFSVILIWALLLIYSIKDLDNRIVFFAFLISFFTFLLGRFLVQSFTTILPDDTFNLYIDFKPDTEAFIFRTILVSLCVIFIGYYFGQKVGRKSKIVVRYSTNYAIRVRQFSKALVYLTFVFDLIESLERVRYAWNNGYFEYYMGFEQALPYMVYKLSSFFIFAVFLYLATLPPKKEAKIVIYLYLFSAFVRFLIGARGAIIYPLFIVLIYLFIRTTLSPDDPWITKKTKRTIVLIAPLFCVGMAAVGLIRSGNSTEGFGLLDAIVAFFFKQGTSYQIIGFVYDNANKMPPDQIYSIGRVFHIFDGSIIGQVLGIDHNLTAQTVEYALKGDELGSYVTYLYDSTIYLNGGGYGSCYIAEAYADLKWFGICLVNFIVGYILAKIPYWMTNRIWLTTISFFILYSFIRAPRGSAFDFLGEILNINYVLMALLIHIAAKYTSK